MDLKQYLEYRADEDCPVGVIAHDLANNKRVPFGEDEVGLINILDNTFKGTEFYENWTALKADIIIRKVVF